VVVPTRRLIARFGANPVGRPRCGVLTRLPYHRQYGSLVPMEIRGRTHCFRSC
jgi:hypothetical protein